MPPGLGARYGAVPLLWALRSFDKDITDTTNQVDRQQEPLQPKIKPKQVEKLVGHSANAHLKSTSRSDQQSQAKTFEQSQDVHWDPSSVKLVHGRLKPLVQSQVQVIELVHDFVCKTSN